MPGSYSMLTVAGIPIGADSYTTCYYNALENNGVHVVKGDLSGRWLLANCRQVDYLHLHWPSFHYSDKSAAASLKKFARFVVLLLLARICRIRLLWTAHNLYPHDRNRLAILDWLARRILVFLSYRVFAHGESAASVVSEEFPGVSGKLIIIPHGNWIGFYADECSRAMARTRLGIPAEQFVFLFLGLCKPYKNLETLIDCFQNGPFGAASLWIAGRFQEADYAARVRAKIERQPQRINLDSRFIPNDELQYYLKACNAVVLPYADILTSGSAMLAISFARPVIAPRLGHLRDVINADCGVLYDTADGEGLSRAMQKAQEDQFDEARILDQARRFEWRDAAMKTIAVLK